jgi:hypothetical protein
MLVGIRARLSPIKVPIALLVVTAMMNGGASAKTVVWDRSTLVQVARGGTYARMVRIPGGDILCGFEGHGAAMVTRSADDGKTWSKPQVVAKAPSGSASNSEMLVLANGSVLYLYNERPNDGVHQFTIQVSASTDSGRTWNHLGTAYTADTEPRNGCWEPSAVQLPSGETQLFFANENPYRNSDEQEITLLRSFDSGRTWRDPKAVSFRKGHRDGMPVPLVLRDGKGVVVAIEDNGYTPMFTPAIIHTTAEDNWNQSCAGAASPRRWRAIDAPTSVEWGGAPYIRQVPGGETILSFQSSVGRDYPQMVVYVGDENARNFRGRSVPFDVPSGQGGWWGSIFIKNATTITAISSFDGGVWAIDGHLQHRD